jgi:glycerol-3-phosphate dehydrogenase (NAD(P)+)
VGHGLRAALADRDHEVTLAARDPEQAGAIAETKRNPRYLTTPMDGVQAAAKNLIALAAGGVDGVGLGDNGKAVLITRGLAEMARLGEACGARPETFAGLAGGRPDRHLLVAPRPEPARR